MHVFCQLVFDKGAKNIQWGKDSVLNECWENWIFTCRRVKLTPHFTPDIKNQLNMDERLEHDLKPYNS